MQRRAHESGTRLAVVFLPDRADIYPLQGPEADETRGTSHAIVETLGEVCRRDGIPFTDLTPLLREQATQSRRLLYHLGVWDDHPTPEGYRIIGEGVAKVLLAKGMVTGAATDPTSAGSLRPKLGKR